MLLAVVSNSAMAEWVKVFFNDTETIYADFASVQNEESNTVKMPNLSDYKTPKKTRNGITYSSMIEPVRYDCKEGKLQALSLAMYSKNMGNGKMVFSESFTKEWIPVDTDSIDHVLWKFACGKK